MGEVTSPLNALFTFTKTMKVIMDHTLAAKKFNLRLNTSNKLDMHI